MEGADREYVIAPWGSDDDDIPTEVVTVELPSRDLTVQLEVPVDVLDSMRELSAQHDISVQTALAERLEINRARVSIVAARTVDDVSRVKKHLTDAREYLTGVEELPTESVEQEIEHVWLNTLDTT